MDDMIAPIDRRYGHKVSKEAAIERVVSFAQEFGEKHLTLACHAAFPLALTPDLLYQIWANFVPQAPWTAVADVLLSPLCSEVGYELYEMDIAVRNLLLGDIKKDQSLGQRRLNKLSDFLTAYAASHFDSDDPDVSVLGRNQQWTALAYTQPGEAARKIAETLKNLISENFSKKVRQENRAEIIRTASLLETLAEPLRDFKPLIVYAYGIANLVRGNEMGVERYFRSRLGKYRNLQVAGVHLPIPSLIFEEEETTFAPFVNRRSEWEQIVLYPSRQYHLFDAPAGYGKTALLRKIHQEFTDRGWLCAYITSREETGDTISLSGVFERLAQELGIQPQGYWEDPRRASLEIGKAIIEKHEDEPGVALLFDIDHAPREDFTPRLKIIVETIIPSIWESLVRESDFFKFTPRNYRVVLAGRYLAVRMKDFDFTSYTFDVTQLQLFNYEMVQDICTPYVGSRLRDQAERDELAAHLLFHSGGHPRCMVRILQEFERRNDPPGEFFLFHQEIIEEIAYAEIAWVRHDIKRDWRSAFEALSVYRRFDYPLLRQLIDANLIRPDLAEDEYDLAVKLKQSYLLGWAGENYQQLVNHISRRLLVLFRNLVAPKRLQHDCYQAKSFCVNRLQSSLESGPFWALEVLFECLQSYITEIDDLKSRHELRKVYFEKDLPITLRLLAEKRDPRAVYMPLKQILKQDWELRFMVNYYLRGESFRDEPYQRMLFGIDQFFRNASSSWEE